MEEKHVTVVVLGDYGRSPRMQYHSLSLAKKEYFVDVVAFKGSEPLQEISESKNIQIHYVRDSPLWLGSFPGIVQYILKTIWRSIFLFLSLFSISKMDYILIQNPPSIPTLPVACFVSWLKKADLIIDFHNYGYTILGLSAGPNSLLVKVAKWCEKYYSKKAKNSLCVTKAMKEDLNLNWNVRSNVFYDCPPAIFRPISIEEKHSFFMNLSKDYVNFKAKDLQPEAEECSRFTLKVNGKVKMIPRRPALVVTSTSWTEDEDFSLLLSALENYEQAACNQCSLPDLIVGITGKGPLKSFYEEQISGKGFSHIEIITLWLKSEEYPTFLACADLGVSLHSSSSGLDLPMKVVDMFGCCLPVCAYNFECLDELVKDGVNGKTFQNSRQLSVQLQKLLQGFPNEQTELKMLKENLKHSGNLRWDENWNFTVNPLFS